MVEASLLAYVGAVTFLFFFWAYGLVSFALDLKNKLIPGVRQYLRGRREQKAAERERREREERERELY
ncbi:hypothetical protein [Halobellus limi]|jgi:hypothetical protein|uniref:Uncharacterized protein n=1 Tax=Halobellus limi TaxID=699433 RepID=A0A1H6C3L6_9EURY|nr:hypothetical protein [Halobellus limi]QCC48587.1 hypothetical protein DV707_13480 [Halobellus limi]SEG67528.1 hypothetical protein SAMN04488133_3185 [Halobellus limi]